MLLFDIAFTGVDSKEDSEVISSTCNPEKREEMMKDMDAMRTSPNPCARQYYEKMHNNTVLNESLTSQEDCELEMGYELEVLHNVESRRILLGTHVSRELPLTTAAILPLLHSLSFFLTLDS